MSATSIQPDHPRRALLFCLDDRKDDIAVAKMRALVEELREARDWTIGPPEFVDETEESDNPDYAPIRTVGGVLDVYSSLPPWTERVPPDVDRAQYEEVALIVDALAKLSAELDTEIALEFDGDSIGWIERGIPDKLVSETLLGEWRRSLA